MRITLALCLVNVGLNAWCIPRWGAAGAAWATAATELLLLLAAAPAVQRGLAARARAAEVPA
jgi:Na+-driven multidrug efflux pump